MTDHLHLVVPGLLGPVPGLAELGLKPAAPALETLLARAETAEADGRSFTSTLFDLFGVPPESGDLPSAAVSRLGDGGAADDACWLHADPVFLKPAADRLLLFDAGMLDIRPADAEGLAALFNQHFAPDGWRIEALHPDRWYLRLPAAPVLQTHPLTDVIGRNIEPWLPAGAEAGKWRSVLNEVQMLFHSSAVNRQREAERLLPVNGLWLSGGGHLPTQWKNGFTSVMTDEPLGRGFARLCGIESCAPSLDRLTVPEPGPRLVVYSALLRAVLSADPQGWADELERFEHWAAALRQRLRNQEIGRLSIYPCDGRVFRVARPGLRRFWKPRRPVMDYLSGR